MNQIKTIDKNYIKIALYKSILFFGLSDAHLNKILSILKIYSLRKGEKVVLESQKGQDIYILICGKIQTYFQSNKKKKIIVKDLIPGDIFGEIGFFTKKRTASCEAKEDSIIGIIKYADFSNLIYKNKKILFNMIKVLIYRIMETDKEIKSLAFNSVFKRVVDEILCVSKHNQIVSISPSELSQKVVASRETVSRVLSLLEKIGAIRRQRNNMIEIIKDKIKQIIC